MFSLVARLKKQKEADQKKHKQQEETAKIYAEYVKSFDGSPGSDTSKFVKSKIYDPATGNIGETTSEILSLEPQKDAVKDPSADYMSQISGNGSTSLSRPASQGKIREIDTFIEEIKERQRALDEKKALQKRILSATENGGRLHLTQEVSLMDKIMIKNVETSNEISDKNNANLFISNLSPNITEDILLKQFGKFGTVNSVKILYQRNERETSHAAICGFVSFQTRDQAEMAKRIMEGVDILGMQCRIGWAKGTPKAAQQSFEEYRGIPKAIPSTWDFLTVLPPKSKVKQHVIDLVAKYVAEAGQEFEHMIINNESNSGLFSFMSERFTPEHVYYRWRVFSYIQGDTVDNWRKDPFTIYRGGMKWNPPTVESGLSNKGTNDVQLSHNTRMSQSGRTPLPPEELEKLRSLLSNSNTKRNSICDVMMFIINHSESAYEVTDILVDSILEDTLNIDLKICRLYILSDVLYNSSASRQFAWIYRTSLERRIPEIFHSIRQFKKKSTSKIAYQQLLDCAMRMVRIWENWTVYAPAFTKGLEAILLGDDLESFKPMPEFDLNRNLLCSDHDGYAMEYFELLSTLPLSWREVAHNYLLMSLKKLKTLCQQRGLLIIPGERKILVTRLIIYDKYWSEKDKMTEKIVCDVKNREEIQRLEPGNLVAKESSGQFPNGTDDQNMEKEDAESPLIPNNQQNIQNFECGDIGTTSPNSDQPEPAEDDAEEETEENLVSIAGNKDAMTAETGTVLGEEDEDIDDIFASDS